MSKKRSPVHVPVELTFEGKSYAAGFYTQRGMVTLDSQWGSKSATYGGGMTAEVMARLLFGEVLVEARREKRLREL